MNQYQRPKPPDMHQDGTPNITTFRARHVNYDPVTEPVTRPRRTGKHTRLILVAVTGALVVLGVFLFFQQAVVPWWNGVQDHWNYGSTPVTQLDADVGHGGTSHFIAEYYRGEIIIIELSLSNPNSLHTYAFTGMVGAI